MPMFFCQSNRLSFEKVPIVPNSNPVNPEILVQTKMRAGDPAPTRVWQTVHQQQCVGLAIR